MVKLSYSFLKDVASVGRKLFFNRLTKKEKSILKHCVERGEIWQIHVDAFGDWVRSGKHDFFKQDDLGYNAIYNEALNRLLNRRLVQQESKKFYRLTGSGFKVARRLVSTDQK